MSSANATVSHRIGSPIPVSRIPRCRSNSCCCVHDRDRDGIRGDVTFYLLEISTTWRLLLRARRYLDEAVQPDIARHEKEEETAPS